jgi:hypothetical protein
MYRFHFGHSFPELDKALEDSTFSHHTGLLGLINERFREGHMPVALSLLVCIFSQFFDAAVGNVGTILSV